MAARPQVDPRLAALVVGLVRGQRDGTPARDVLVAQAESVLTELFGLSNDDAARSYPYTLADVFASGVAAVESRTSSGAGGAGAGAAGEDVESSEAFKRFLARVKTAGVFKGAVEGTPEYDAVYKVVVQKFKARQQQKAAASDTVTSSAPRGAAPPPVPSAAASGGGASASAEDAVRQADRFKEQGNDFMKARRFGDAVSMYSRAIEAAPTAPHAHVYFSNRAAAHLRLESFQSAEADARSALKLQPAYTKAKTRLGTALLKQDRYAEAIDVFEEVLADTPENDAAREWLAMAKAKKAEKDAKVAAPGGAAGGGMPGMGGMPGLGGMPGMGGMPGLGGMDFGAMMNNPMMQSMMSNPAVMQMAQNMMSNPDMMNSLGSMLGGGAGGGGGGMPDMSALAGMMGGMGMGGGAPGGSQAPTVSEVDDDDTPVASAPAGGMGGMGNMMENLRNRPDLAAYRDDPRLAELWADMSSGGPAAAMRHMGNPAVQEMMSKLMRPAPADDDDA